VSWFSPRLAGGEQLRESPEVLKELLTFMTKRMAGEDAEGLADEVAD